MNPIHARVTLTATLNEKGKPVMKAFYERLDIYPITDYNQELNVDYKTESYPQKISLVSASGSGFNFSGSIYSAIEYFNKDCSQNFVDNECQFYLQGDLILSKNQKASAKLVRIKDRYQAQDSAVLGRYRGTIKFFDRPNQTAVTLNLSVFVQNGAEQIKMANLFVVRYLRRIYNALIWRQVLCMPLAIMTSWVQIHTT